MAASPTATRWRRMPAWRRVLVRIALALPALALAVAACGTGGSGGGGNAGSTGGGGGYGGGYGSGGGGSGGSSATAGNAAMLKVASLGGGQALVDGSGKALYLFEKDTGTSSTCYDACATAWPPLLTSGKPTAGGKVQAGELGTTKRSDGTMQVTYHGHPLYYFFKDKAAGDIKGQGVDAFGAPWYLVTPSGDALTRG